MHEELIKYLTEDILNNRMQISADEDLLGSGLVDSMGMMRFIAFIEKRCDFKVPPEDLVIENFMSVDVIVEYLNDKGATA